MAEKTFIKVPEEATQHEAIISIEDIAYVRRDVKNPSHSIIVVARGNFSKEVVVSWSFEKVGSTINARMSDDPQVL